MSGRRVSDLGERALIARLAARVGAGRDVTVGIGDDCAVVAPRGGAADWALTSDPVIEGVHFTSAHAGERVGRKAVGRALSDLAAMGAEPRWLLINLVAPPAAAVARLDAVYRGATQRAAEFGAAIVGGDVARGPRLELHVFGVGRLPPGRAIRRAGARPGDRLFVTGELGGSLAGRHLDFVPRVREGIWLRKKFRPTAMLDVSDGLASDARRLLEESGVGARLRLSALPIAAAAWRARGSRTPLRRALEDGEDFELLFTLPPRRAAAFARAWGAAFPGLRCTEIGVITDAPGRLEMEDGEGRCAVWSGGGFEHFRAGVRGVNNHA